MHVWIVYILRVSLGGIYMFSDEMFQIQMLPIEGNVNVCIRNKITLRNIREIEPLSFPMNILDSDAPIRRKRNVDDDAGTV